MIIKTLDKNLYIYDTKVFVRSHAVFSPVRVGNKVFTEHFYLKVGPESVSKQLKL